MKEDHVNRFWRICGLALNPMTIALLALILNTSCIVGAAERKDADKPNIVYILCDDLGYGDVHCLNPDRGKIATPNIDKLATQGMTFTEAHGSSAVCTPSRYGILTGRYNWRSTLQRGVLGPYGPPLIARDRLTVPALLKQHGYDTAAIGKWHLGWEWPGKGKQHDFTQPIAQGPITRGFDYYFGTDVPNYPPYCFIENDHTVGLPTAQLPARLLGHNLASKAGPALPGWKLEEILPTITDKSCAYITDHARTGKPFFLYFALTSPHTPLAPTKEWEGKSGLGRYADFVMETDAMVGRVLDAIDKSGAAGNTLVFLASDNGCAPYIGVKELEAKGHFPSAYFRGYKSDAWDGGHHIPFIARWPEVTKAGSQCAQLVCQNDLMATCAQIIGAKLPDNAGEDSVSLLPLLQGTDQPVRPDLVHHSIEGKFAIREGKWKLLLCPGSGGWGAPNDAAAKKQHLPPVQLYDMAADIGEKNNLQAQHPEIVQRLTKLLEKYVADGRSTPGAPQKNDTLVNVHEPAKAGVDQEGT
jgi:arylsulfatase A-like enzyme